jgi:hypothetical protein
LKKLLLTAPALLFLGCGGAVESISEAVVASAEKPNVEKQLNRISLGINILRTNSDMLYNTPISVDAEWVDKISGDISNSQENMLKEKYLYEDPYYATVQITDAMAGSLPVLSPLALSFYNRVDILYEEAPDMNQLPGFDMEKYKEFPDAKIKKVEAVEGNLYLNLEDAIVALIPEQNQDKSADARSEWQSAVQDITLKKRQVAELELEVETGEEGYREQFEIAKKELAELERVAEEKEAILNQELQKAVNSLKGDIDPAKLPLAKKVNAVLEAVEAGAVQTTTLFAIALQKLPDSLKHLAEEQTSLDKVKMIYAMDVSKEGRKTYEFLNQRSSRLVSNAQYAIPYVTIGSYLIGKQLYLVSSYSDIVEVYLELEEK